MTALVDEKLAFARLLEERALQFSETPFRLRAGGESQWYCDIRAGVAHGRDLKRAGALLVQRATEVGVVYDHVVGMGIGGRALMTAMVLVRPELHSISANDDTSPDQRYSYGLHGAKFTKETGILLVDDMATTGNSLVTTADMVRGVGGAINDALVLVDRSEGRVEDRMAALGIDFHAVFKFIEDGGHIVPV